MQRLEKTDVLLVATAVHYMSKTICEVSKRISHVSFRRLRNISGVRFRMAGANVFKSPVIYEVTLPEVGKDYRGTGNWHHVSDMEMWLSMSITCWCLRSSAVTCLPMFTSYRASGLSKYIVIPYAMLSCLT